MAPSPLISISPLDKKKRKKKAKQKDNDLRLAISKATPYSPTSHFQKGAEGV